MKRHLILLLLLLAPVALSAAKKQPEVQHIHPSFWWAGMKETSLQILLHGPALGGFDAEVQAQGVRVDSIVRPANGNYLLLYLNLADAQPQTMHIILTQGKLRRDIPYTLRSRADSPSHEPFTAADVIYLLMPDRFANGDPANDVVDGMKESTSSPEPFARHGGDLAGIEQHIDYFADLGVTAVWPTPILVNDMPEGSYHGYAITDYYQVDPRLGTNEDYCRLIQKLHARGIKMVQDMVFNHCGLENFLYRDLPDSTWFNCGSQYVQTNYKISSVGDPHASLIDYAGAQDGWFVEAMPDLNQRNPHVMKYLIQNSIWWIGYAGVDGIRQDTYPYTDLEAMAGWCKAVQAEYPGYNIVGETWINHNVGVSYWQKDSPLAAPKNSQLPSVMDFPLNALLCNAITEETNDWDRGLARIYEYLSQDGIYADPMNLLTFLANHDTPRFARNADEARNEARYRQALALLLTLRGIPQLYVGDEIAMYADKSGGDGLLRRDFPGGFPGDGQADHFTPEGRTPLAARTYNYTRQLLHWRQGHPALAKGTLTQFAVRNGVYAYTRQAEGRTVTVFLNGTDQPQCVDLAHYAEALPAPNALNVITGRSIPTTGSLQLGVREVVILDF